MNHFHFAWQRKNILSTIGDKKISVRDYIDYWRRELSDGNIRKYNKEKFGLLKKRLCDANIMNDNDIAKFDEYFRSHSYQSAITCPGIVNFMSFPIDRLKDNNKQLAEEFRPKIISLMKIYSLV